jgi:DNA-binding XRE family transcriptional regulator
MEKDQKTNHENWNDFKKQIYTEEEISELDLKAELICSIIDARTKQGVSQRDLEELSGIKQPVIARVEKGRTDPQLSTLLKILRVFGKTLAIVPLKRKSGSVSTIMEGRDHNRV